MFKRWCTTHWLSYNLNIKKHKLLKNHETFSLPWLKIHYWGSQHRERICLIFHKKNHSRRNQWGGQSRPWRHCSFGHALLEEERAPPNPGIKCQSYFSVSHNARLSHFNRVLWGPFGDSADITKQICLRAFPGNVPFGHSLWEERHHWIPGIKCLLFLRKS